MICGIRLLDTLARYLFVIDSPDNEIGEKEPKCNKGQTAKQPPVGQISVSKNPSVGSVGHFFGTNFRGTNSFGQIFLRIKFNGLKGKEPWTKFHEAYFGRKYPWAKAVGQNQAAKNSG